MFEDYEALYMALMGLTGGPYEDGFDALAPAAQAMYVAAILDMEIQNGGAVQFFANWGANCALRAAESLRMVGLPRMARTYESFLAEHDFEIHDLKDFDCGEDVEAFVALYDKYGFLNELDEFYMELRDEEDFEARMLECAAKNADIFRESGMGE